MEEETSSIDNGNGKTVNTINGNNKITAASVKFVQNNEYGDNN